jgi:hypothetical protein
VVTSSKTFGINTKDGIRWADGIPIKNLASKKWHISRNMTKGSTDGVDCDAAYHHTFTLFWGIRLI